MKLDRLLLWEIVYLAFGMMLTMKNAMVWTWFLLAILVFAIGAVLVGDEE